MPTTIFLRNGSKFTLKGSGPGAVIKRFLRPMAAGIAVNGHLVEFRWRERIFVDAQPEAEYQEELAKQAQAQAKAEKEQAEAKAQAEKEKDAGLAKASEAFIAKHGPDPANWPESMRPKPKPDTAAAAAAEN